MIFKSILTFGSVEIKVDIERFADHIKNYRASNEQQIVNNLGRLRKFYMLGEEQPVQKDPLVVVDCHGRIVCWSLPMILSKHRLVSVYSQ
jgi:hypothetical protein